LGITRSALANYELGRSSPPQTFLDRLKDRLGVDVDTGPELADFEEHIRSIVGDGSRLTEDEWAVVRTLRVAQPDDTRRVVAELVACIERRKEGLNLVDPQSLAGDLARLYMIAGGHAEFIRGISGAGVVQIARAIADAAIRRAPEGGAKRG